MSTDPTTSPHDGPEARRRTRRRFHPLVVGLLSTAVSLAAAVGAAAVYVAVADPPASPTGAEPELTIRFTPEDAEGADANEPVAEPKIAGRALPETSFPLLDGGEATFADYRGRPLVVNVWSSTCAPCLEEMPDLEQVSTEHGDHLAFVGLALLDEPDGAQAMVDETGVTYDIGLDPTGEITQAIGAVGLPATLFVDADGRVVDTKTGKMAIDEIRTRVEALLE